MSKIKLVEEGVYELGRQPETLAERVVRLQQEAKLLAREQVESFQRQMRLAAELGREISEGGDVYPVGIRELASRLSSDLGERARQFEPLIERTWGHAPKMNPGSEG